MNEYEFFLIYLFIYLMHKIFILQNVREIELIYNYCIESPNIVLNLKIYE